MNWNELWGFFGGFSADSRCRIILDGLLEAENLIGAGGDSTSLLKFESARQKGSGRCWLAGGHHVTADVITCSSPSALTLHLLPFASHLTISWRLLCISIQFSHWCWRWHMRPFHFFLFSHFRLHFRFIAIYQLSLADLVRFFWAGKWQLMQRPARGQNLRSGIAQYRCVEWTWMQICVVVVRRGLAAALVIVSVERGRPSPGTISPKV